MIEYQKAGIDFLFADLLVLRNLNKRNSRWRRKGMWVQSWLLEREENVLL